jgi:hypothetical protein
MRFNLRKFLLTVRSKHKYNKLLYRLLITTCSVTKLKKLNMSSCPKRAQYLLQQAVEILRCVGGLCRPLQVFRANQISEEFRHQTKDDVKLTSAQMSQLVSLWSSPVKNPLLFSFSICNSTMRRPLKIRNVCISC